MVQYFKTPASLINRALDALGVGFAIGSLDDGTPITETARRNYGPMLRELLRAAQWGFARKNGPLTPLLGSSSGQDWNGNLVNQVGVEQPWMYCYAWPIDGVAARWVPWHYGQGSGSIPPGNITQPGGPGPQAASFEVISPNVRQQPARFLVSSSDQFPSVIGQTDWDALPDLSTTEGVGPVGRRVVLTNVPAARLVYTRLVLSIEEWDQTFEQTMVAYMAQRLALIAVKDPKAAIVLRNAQIAIVKDQLTEARARNADDAGFPQSFDHVPDWIRVRRYGATRWGEGGLNNGPGVLGYGFDTLSFSDGSVF